MKEKTTGVVRDIGELGFYVYVYIDPRNDEPFYVGKGKNRRMLAHLDMRDEKKAARINEIRESGEGPRIDILHWGMNDEAEALAAEAAVIEFIGKDKLVNRVSGHTRGRGRIPGYELDSIINAESVEVRHKAVLLNLNREYRYGMTNPDGTTTDALYKVTSGSWRAGIQRAQKAECVMAVYQGVVREVYRIDEWYVAPDNKQRICFNGAVAEDIRGQYVGGYVGWGKKGAQNPVRYECI